MGLENLTPEERRQIQQQQEGSKLLNELLNDPNVEVRRTAQRLVKAKRPDVRFAELEAEEAAQAASKASNDRLQKLEEELTQERALRQKSQEENVIRARGYDPAAVYKLMEEKGVANLDTMLDVLDADAQLGESSSGFRPFKNPAEDILKKVKAENGRIDVEALRSELVTEAVNEMGGRRVSPLGWMKPAQQQ